jgi:4-diphosphocytidyl-2-C-methyl-D-erythritol kinase
LENLNDTLIFSQNQAFQGPEGPKDTLTYISEVGPPFSNSPLGDVALSRADSINPQLKAIQTPAVDSPDYFDAGFKDDNLSLRALRAFRQLTGWPKEGLNIHLIKRIPLRAGLGGGSSDAGAVLRFLNQSGLLEPDELKALALSLGGDVPFFLERCPRCLASGVGEILEPYNGPVPGRYVLLINPGAALSTAEVFRELSLTISVKSSNSFILDRRETFFPGLPFFGQNDLLSPALRLCPALEEVRHTLAKLSPKPLSFGLSGSGPTFWALYSTVAETQQAAGSIWAADWWVRTAVLED